MPYILLFVESEEEAKTLSEDLLEYPDTPLLTPVQEHEVHAKEYVVVGFLPDDL